ncbi:Acyl-homoserine-lactone synthase [Curvibacter sp. AEP1-3]|nr:Acyl-homoserine-lactone synthase [Curvibacter sp. AEP1-3]
MHCVAGRREELPPHLMEAVGRYRHKVFVSHLGWSLRSSGEVEADEFDGPDAVYVSSQDKHGHVNGVARLLPTTVPYLLEKVFPSLWGGLELPRSAEVWELSRFAAVDFDTCASLANQASASHAASLFQQVVRIAAEHGARTLITVSPVGMERLLRVNGFRAIRAGVPAQQGGCSVVALSIPLSEYMEVWQ